MPASSSRRKPAVVVVGVLLLCQALFLFALFPTVLTVDFLIRPEAHMSMFFPDTGGFVMPQVEVESLQTLDILFHFPDATVTVPGQIVGSVVFSFLALPVLVVGLLFLAGWRPSWGLALFFQALILSLALAAYFNYHHPYVYLVMGFSIFLVFYLNHYEIQASYRRPLKISSEARK
jgi:hypothetical protein